jgi:hypothetical protein
VYGSTLIVFLKLKVKRRCRAIEGIPGGSRDSFMQRRKKILLETNVFLLVSRLVISNDFKLSSIVLFDDYNL